MPEPTGTANLQRFVTAQEGVYPRALAEIRAGRKTTHWIWFIFPQVAGLGRSETSARYALQDVDEARAYLAHPVLGPRLAECIQAMLDQPTTDAERILGGIDAVKFRSSLTLFAQVSPPDSLVHQALTRFFGGRADERTLGLLAP